MKKKINELILNDIFPEWLTGKGILATITSNHDVPWKDDIPDGSILDLEYYGNHSGNKIIAPIMYRLITVEDSGISDINRIKLASLIWTKYGLNWTKLYNTLSLEYNPISNYDMTESEKITGNNKNTHSGKNVHTKDGSDSTNHTGSTTTSTDTYGFNSTNSVPASKTTSSYDGSGQSDVTNYDITEEEDINLTVNNENTQNRTLTRSGNIGVTTSQQMIESERTLWDWQFFEQVYSDIDEIMTIPTFGEGCEDWIDIVCEHGISYILPVASPTVLGGVKPAAKTNDMTSLVGVDSEGKLWSVAGGGAGGSVSSVNGKTGAVILNAADIGALPEDTALFDGDYNSLSNKPALFDGDYNSLSNKPDLNVYQLKNDSNLTTNSKSVVGAINEVNTNLLALNVLGYSIPKEVSDWYIKKNGNQVTVYGGRVKLEDLTWNYSSAGFYYSNEIADFPAVRSGGAYKGYCTKYNYSNALVTWSDITTGNNVVTYSNGTIFDGKVIEIRDTSLGTSGKPSGWLYYELGTPITYTIDGNEALSKVNASLGDYGLENKVTSIEQGNRVGDKSIDEIINNPLWVTPADIFNADGQIHVITDNLFPIVQIIYWDFNKNYMDYINILNQKDFKHTPPANAKYATISFGSADGPEITPTTCGRIAVYINNSIDAIKADLSGLKFTVSGNTLSITDGVNTWSIQ